jgi:hypothetical protein
MTLAELKQAGFGQQEIDDYVSKERTRLSGAGFSEPEINTYFGQEQEQPLSANQYVITDPQDVNVSKLPDVFNNNDKAKIETAKVLSDEFEVDSSTVMAGYDNFVYKKFGRVISPSAVKAKLVEEGLLTDPENDRNDIASIADSIVNGKSIDPKIKNRIRISSLNKQVSRLKQSFKEQDNFIQQNYLNQASATAKPSNPNVIFAEEVETLTPENLLNFDVFLSAVGNSKSAEQVQELLNKRKVAFNAAIKEQRLSSLYSAKVELAKNSETTVIKEFGRGLATGTLQAVRGLSGLAADLTGTLQPGFEKARTEATVALKSPVLISPEHRTALQYVSNTLGQTLPYFATGIVGRIAGSSALATKAGQILGTMTTGFAVEGESAYQDALANGATESQAQSERVLVGTINSGIEALQVEKLFRFAGKDFSKNALVSSVKKKVYTDIAKNTGKFTLEGVKLSISEGIEEALQEGVSISVPAMLRGDYAKLPNGKPDWWSITSRLNEAYWGGATAGVFLGGAGKIYNSMESAKHRNNLAASITIFEGINYHTAKTMADDLMGRKIKTQEEYDNVYSELLEKYQPLGEIGKELKDVGVDTEAKIIENRPQFQEMMRKSSEGIIEAEPYPQSTLDEDFYEKNKIKEKITVKENFRDIAREIRLKSEKALASISTRLEMIDPKLKYDVRNVFFTTNSRTAKYTNVATEFFDKTESIKKQNPNDYRRFELAIRNSDDGMIDYITKIYGVEKEYGKYRKSKDEIYELANRVGMSVDYLESHFHRQVINLDGLLKELQTTENWSMIQKAFDAKQEQKGGRALTPEEKANIVNSLLRGYNVGQIMLARPGATKERTVGIIDKKLEKYYASWQKGEIDYISTMSKQITIREFFGKQAKEVVRQREIVNRIKTTIHNLKTGQTFQDISDSERQTRIKNTQTKLAKAEAEYDRVNNDVLENSIGKYISELVESGKIDSGQQKEIADMFNALFDPKKMDKWLSSVQKLAYVETLSQITNAITQLGELGLSVMRSPTGSLTPIARAFIGKSKIKIHDIYVHEIGEEWKDNQFGKIGGKLLWSLQKMDTIGKEAYINTVINKYQKAAVRNPDKLKTEISRIFGEETDSVIKDLAENKISENVKLLAFNETADVQPIAISEMPEYYAKGGNWRVFYMLRTFTIKRLDMIRRECFSLMANPIDKPKDFMKGAGRLFWMGFVLMLCDATADAIKDFFRGKPIEWTDNIIDNMWQNTLIINKYTLQKARGEGFSAIARNVLPMIPTKALDAFSKDIYQIFSDNENRRYQGFETPKIVPYLGEPYYWWFGKGREKIEQKQGSKLF